MQFYSCHVFFCHPGIDLNHPPPDAPRGSGFSVAAVVASLDPDFGRWTTRVLLQSPGPQGREIVVELDKPVRELILEYRRHASGVAIAFDECCL